MAGGRPAGKREREVFRDFFDIFGSLHIWEGCNGEDD